MLSFFFLVLGAVLGWWIRGTKAGAWISKQLGRDE